MPSAAFHQRALRTAAGLWSARGHGWMIPDRAAEEINKALRAGDEGWAFNLVIQARDHLAEMLDSNDRGSDSSLLRSRRVTDPRYETLLAALVEHEFDKRSRQPKPDWVKGPRMDPAWTQHGFMPTLVGVLSGPVSTLRSGSHSVAFSSLTAT